MKASIGRTVIVHGLSSNGSNQHPAVITRAWSDVDTADKPVAVNLTVFPDCSEPVNRGSVLLYDNEAKAVAAFEDNQPKTLVAFWPGRV